MRLLNSLIDDDPNTLEDNNHPQNGGLFPQLFNVASRAAISVNGTCGEKGREEYCKLVDAYPHQKWATQCGVCNAHSSDLAKRRPIESVINFNGGQDNDNNQWWQSPTLQYGRHYEYITIILDLKQVTCNNTSLTLLISINSINKLINDQFSVDIVTFY